MNLRRRLQNYIALNNYVEAFRSNVLPDGYTQLEYIESSGTQYIDTGIKGNGTTKVHINARYYTTTSAGGSGRIFGSRDAAAVNAFAVGSASGTASTSSTVAFFFGNQSYLVTDKPIILDEWLDIVFDKTTHNINGVDYGDSYNAETFETPQTLKIFGFDNSGTMGIGYVDIAYCKVWNNDILVRNFIPAKRNSDNVIGMYDTVSNRFFTNEGTGNFIAGPNVSKTPYSNKVYLEDSIKDGLSSLNVYGKSIQSNIPDIYEELEYIVFDSTQIIDTGFTPDNDSRIESKCYRTGEDCWFYGASPTNPRITLYHSRTGTCRWGNQSRSNVGFVADTEYTIIEDKNGLIINGIDNPWNAGTAGDFTCDRSLTIGNNNGSSGTRYFAGNLYYMKIYDNDVLARDFVPAKRKSDNVVGLYDKITKILFVNNVGNNLIAGPAITPTPINPIDIYCSNGKLVFGDPDVPSEYKRLLDIIFDGDIYYVTNTYLTGADTTTFTMNATENGRNVLGCYTGSGSGNNLSFYLSTGNTGNYVRYKDSLYRPILANSILNTDLTLSIGPTGTTGFDTDATWTELEFVSPEAFYIGWLANATSPKFKGSFIGNITVSNSANFIPCERVSDNAIGYYDTYSNTFFENQGTGTPTTSGYDYSHYTVIAEGTPEKLNIKGNNLYDITKDVNDKYIDVNGNIGDDTSLRACYSDLIPVKFGEMYTYSGICKSSSGASNAKRIHGYIDGVWNQQIQALNIDINKPFSYTFTIPANINGIRISHWKDDEKTQLEECYRPTKYNNYLDMNLDVANLLSISDYIDSQDILNGVINRQLGVLVLDGTESWQLATATNLVQFYTSSTQGIIANSVSLTSTIAPYGCTAATRTQYDFGCYSGASGNLCFQMKGSATLTTTSAWTQYLADQYAARTPVIVIYPLATPTTESTTSQTTLLSSNNNVIIRDSKYIDDLGLDLTYKKLR